MIFPRRLIEVDLPIRAISEHARRDKNIHKGHPHTTHVWWATRPRASCMTAGGQVPLATDEHKTGHRNRQLRKGRW